MNRPALGLLLLLCGAGTATLACSIQDRIVDHIGDTRMVSGYCSNNGGAVECIYSTDGGWSCTGPVGVGTDESMMLMALAQACGCGSGG